MDQSQRGQVLVAGSGLAAAAVARAAAAAGLPVTLIDEREPVAAHPIGEAEWYSAWPPGADDLLAQFAGLGVDRLEELHRESGAAFRANRRGLLLVTARAAAARTLAAAAGRNATHGGGPLREHAVTDWYLPSPDTGFRGVPDGFDVFPGEVLRRVFPFVAPSARLGIHVRRAGWIDARALRRWLLADCREAGGVVLPETIADLGFEGHGGWSVRLASGAVVTGDALVLVGPRARVHSRRAGFELGWLEATRMIGYLEGGGSILAEHGPMVVSADAPHPQGERSSGDLAPTLGLAVPSLLPTEGGHLRAESVAAGAVRPDQLMAMGEATLRDMAAIVPDLETRRGPPGRYSIASAPLTLAPDLRPVVGMADRRAGGGYLVGGLGGGASSVLAAADLLVSYLAGRPLPAFAPSFAPSRLPLPDDRSRVSEFRSG